ncbi:MAG: glycosyltransferase [Thermodesulfobacteriota bacterium]
MSRTGRFSSALREFTRKQIERLASADVVVGIPAYYSDDTIAHVIEQVAEGLQRHYPELRALIMIADGGSTDDTREVAQNVEEHAYNLEIITTIYRGMPGKGSAFRAIFETARFLRARAVAVFDSDLKSINHAWVRNILDPVFRGYDFVAPDYSRYKFDGTITNTIAYNLTRALYGCNIRQPIGGDFGVSMPLVRYYLEQDVWETDIARFGVDIWMTTAAITGGFRICQARLGAKIHGEKDPAADLGPMFREVVGTIFRLMEQNYPFWKKVAATETPPTFGEAVGVEPEAFEINVGQLVDYFRLGHQNFGGVWKNIIDPEDFAVIERLARAEGSDGFDLPVEVWVRIVYRYACHCTSAARQRMKILDTLIPLYNARVASLVTVLKDKTQQEAEEYYDAQARVFESMRPYLLADWERSGAGQVDGLPAKG